MSFRFYLGIHRPNWLELSPVPTFLSARQLWTRKRLPRARADWALDSGGFTELSQHGAWTSTPRAYVELVRRLHRDVGKLEWAAAQDWMCEPQILKRTGLSVAEHQRRTLDNYLALCDMAPELPWVPVLQGWTHGDYLDHFEAYEAAGVDLRVLPRVGIGTMCRRQHMMRATFIINDLAGEGLRLHAFGFKLTGLRDAAPQLASADSMAWSFAERRERTGQQNSLDAALEWYRHIPCVAQEG